MSNAHLRSRITHRFKRSETQGATAINMIQYTVHTLISLFVHILVIRCIAFQLCATTAYCHCTSTHVHTTFEAHNQAKLCQVYCPHDFHIDIRDASKCNYISCNYSPKLTQVPPSRSPPKQLLPAAKNGAGPRSPPKQFLSEAETEVGADSIKEAPAQDKSTPHQYAGTSNQQTREDKYAAPRQLNLAEHPKKTRRTQLPAAPPRRNTLEQFKSTTKKEHPHEHTLTQRKETPEQTPTATKG